MVIFWSTTNYTVLNQYLFGWPPLAATGGYPASQTVNLDLSSHKTRAERVRMNGSPGQEVRAQATSVRIRFLSYIANYDLDRCNGLYDHHDTFDVLYLPCENPWGARGDRRLLLRFVYQLCGMYWVFTQDNFIDFISIKAKLHKIQGVKDMKWRGRISTIKSAPFAICGRLKSLIVLFDIWRLRQ